MKTIIKIISIILTAVQIMFQMLNAQPSLQHLYNAPRVGDHIVKQQVEYKDPGRAGENVVWDFSYLELINDEYYLDYDSILGIYLTGTEHYTIYYHILTDTALWIDGFENPVNLAKYSKALLKDVYPLNYGDSIEQEYALDGIFSGRRPFAVFGQLKIKADAHGMLVLPSGDTLRKVLRVKTEQISLSDSSVLENYRYFARGFRYPVFEIVRDKRDNFATAFFFPPPQDEFFETPDSANQNLLAMDSVELENIQYQQNPWEGMYYNLSPNPVIDNMLFEIYLPKSVNNLRVQITHKNGVSVYNQNKGSFPEGLNAIWLNLSNLSFGNYLLDFWLDGYLVSGSIILKN
jgi:hypothetical protein